MSRSRVAADARAYLEMRRGDIGRCVKCGTCAAVCPSYAGARDETYSARGRMALVQAVLDRRIAVAKAFRDRLAACTTCLSCESVCPIGVPVVAIIQAAKELAVAEAGPGFVNSLAAGVLRRPLLFGAVARLAPLFLHLPAERRLGETTVRKRAAAGTPEARALFFPGCAVQGLQSDIGRAVKRVLGALGYDVITPAGLQCCGRPFLSLGLRKRAEDLARRNARILTTTKADVIVTACAACGMTFKKDYPALLGGVRAPVVLDIHEVVGPRLSRVAWSSVAGTITWHEPCHLGRGQGLGPVARSVLDAVPGLDRVEMEDADRCCGFGGALRLTQHRLSDAIGGAKARAVLETKASRVVTGCPGCRMQISAALRRAGSDVVVLHTVQVLEEALTGERQ